MSLAPDKGFSAGQPEVERVSINAPSVEADALLIRPVTLPTPSRSDVARRLGVGIRAVSRRLPATTRMARGGPSQRRLAMARLIRETFEELGGTFSKFGQLVGSAPSLFGEEVAHEFRGFLDRGQPVPYAAVTEIVAAELGRPVDQLFTTFEREPIAAASLA